MFPTIPTRPSGRRARTCSWRCTTRPNAWFQRNLRMGAGEIARNYLNNRGMTPDVIEKFGLGYSPDDWHGLDNFLKGKGQDFRGRRGGRASF